jgi:hypothetical protein
MRAQELGDGKPGSKRLALSQRQHLHRLMSLDNAIFAAFKNILSQLRKISLDACLFCGILSGQIRQKKRSNNESGRLLVWTATKRPPATNNQL